MIQRSIFLCGDGVLSHPVTYLFHLDADTARGEPGAETLRDKRLAVADCRTAAPGALEGWARAAREAGVPLLLLCPSRTDLEPLAQVFGIVPDDAAAALLAVALPGAEGEPVGSYLEVLGYTLLPTGEGSAEGLSKAAETGGPVGPGAAVECACTDVEVLGGMLVEGRAADAFKYRVERVMGGWLPAAASPPTGLKYVRNVVNYTSPFTYAGADASNGAGSLTIAWTVWGFLSQSPSENAQYLAVQATYSLNPGSLHSDSSCDRGYGNASFQAAVSTPLSGADFAPQSSSGSASGNVDVTLSYKQPLGGYGTWDYTDTFTDSFTSWNVKPIGSGGSLGAMWWMTSPCNGSDLSSTWEDAFTFWGHVNEISGSSSGTLLVHATGVWNTTSLVTGTVAVDGSFGWIGTRFWGGNCSPGMYWTMHPSWRSFLCTAGFKVDFSSLQPS